MRTLRRGVLSGVRCLLTLLFLSGFVQAQTEVADNYEHGRGVPKDEKLALLWYRKAAAAGVEYAREVLKRKGVAE